MKCLKSVFAVLLVTAVAFGLAGCSSDEDNAVAAVSYAMDAYTAPYTEKDGEKGAQEGNEAPAPAYADDATMAQLEAYGVDAGEYRRHALQRMTYEVGECSVADDGASATVQLTVTNVSLSAAADAAAADYAAYAQTEDAASAYNESGRPALFSKLIEYLYAHLDGDELVQTTVAVEARKDDSGAWTFDPAGNDDFFRALYGGSDVIGGLAPEEEPSD